MSLANSEGDSLGSTWMEGKVEKLVFEDRNNGDDGSGSTIIGERRSG